MAFPNWTGARKSRIKIDHTKVTAGSDGYYILTLDQTDILTYASEALDLDGTYGALQGGGDIRFSVNEDGTSQLALHVIDCTLNNNPNLSTCEFNVCLPFFPSASVDNYIYMEYHQVGETQPAEGDTCGKHAVYSPLSCVLTLSMKESVSDSSPQLIDGTGYSNDFTKEGNPTNTTGLIGGAWDMSPNPASAKRGSAPASLIFSSGEAIDYLHCVKTPSSLQRYGTCYGIGRHGTTEQDTNGHFRNGSGTGASDLEFYFWNVTAGNWAAYQWTNKVTTSTWYRWTVGFIYGTASSIKSWLNETNITGSWYFGDGNGAPATIGITDAKLNTNRFSERLAGLFDTLYIFKNAGGPGVNLSDGYHQTWQSMIGNRSGGFAIAEAPSDFVPPSEDDAICNLIGGDFGVFDCKNIEIGIH